MKILHVRFDEKSGHHFAVITGTEVGKIAKGSALRCAAYRFTVEEVSGVYEGMPEPTSGFLLAGVEEPTEGMVVHLAQEQLTDEEMSIALNHLLMLPSMLKGIDAEGVALRIVMNNKRPLPDQVQRLIPLLVPFCQLVAELTRNAPSNALVFELKRYQSEILKGC